MDLPPFFRARVSCAQHDLIVLLKGELTGGDASEVLHIKVVFLEGVLDVVLVDCTVGKHVVDQVSQLIGQILAEVVVLFIQGLEVRNEHTEAAAYSLLSLKRRAAQKGQREEHGHTRKQRATSNHHSYS